LFGHLLFPQPTITGDELAGCRLREIEARVTKTQ
jgi:hypothetical protein